MMKRGLKISEQKIQEAFEEWNGSELQSFLIEITAEILKKQDDNTKQLLVNLISDRPVQREQENGHRKMLWICRYLCP
jgi:6-phosphogluconate dehydrogenase